MPYVGEVTSFEICPSLVKMTKRMTYSQLDEVLEKEKVSISPSSMEADLCALNRWALLRNSYRKQHQALDEYLHHKTELSLSVRMDPKSSLAVVSGKS